jgi:hypothetical protein
MLHIFRTYNIFLSLLLLPPFFTLAQNTSVENDSKRTGDMINNLTNQSPIFNTEIKPQFITNTSTIIHAIGVKVGDITILVKQMITDTVTRKNYECLKAIIKNILWKYRYKIAGGTLIGSYSATSLLLVANYHQIYHSVFWAHWKNKSSFEDLCSIPQKELAKELLLAIGEHHYNKDNPTDLAYPLVTFIKDIDWEISLIKQYITTAQTIKSLFLMPLFPTNDKKIQQAKRLLERDLFIKHIFLSWLADYNLTSAEKLNA